jgi:hypothetical protein
MKERVVHAYALCVVMLLLFAATARPAEQDEMKPLVVPLPDDVETRGDWLGTYGTDFYVLGGMRSSHALQGGRQIDYAIATGREDERAR